MPNSYALHQPERSQNETDEGTITSPPRKDKEVLHATVAADRRGNQGKTVALERFEGMQAQVAVMAGKRMLRLWGGKCAVTGCSIEQVLVASHAKPWVDSSNEERLDEHNGLLLSASIDRLFDAGLISFANDGSLLVSGRLEAKDLEKMGLNGEAKLRFLTDAHKPYLKAHRVLHGFTI